MGFASSVQSRSTRDCVRNDVFQKNYTLTHIDKTNRISDRLHVTHLEKAELELRHKKESAVKSLT